MKRFLLLILLAALPLVALAEETISQTNTVCVSVTPDTSAYAAGDIVGGVLTFAGLLHPPRRAGMIQSVEIMNSEIDGIAWEMCIFPATPTGTVADQGPPTLAATQQPKCFSVSETKSFATTQLMQNSAVNRSIDGASTSLYGLLITAGAPTWAAAQTVRVCITVIND